jgi:hypothetical protein
MKPLKTHFSGDRLGKVLVKLLRIESCKLFHAGASCTQRRNLQLRFTTYKNCTTLAGVTP